MTKSKLLDKLEKYLCPSLLGAVVCFSIIYTLYKQGAWIYSAVFLIAELLLFSLFDILKNKKRFGGLIYMGIMAVFYFISLNLLFRGAVSGGTDFLSWFYADDGTVYEPLYMNAVFLGGGFFVISILYYFTQVRYRSLGVMLSILFPFVIYAKRAEEIPELLVTLIITLYLAVMVHNRRIDPAQPVQEKGRLIINRAYIIGVAIFVSVTGAVTMLIDKPDYQSKLEKDSNYFNQIQTDAVGSGDYEDTSSSSSKRYGTGSGSKTPLFYFYTNGTNDIYYLRRQSYDYYDSDANVWKIDRENSDYSSIYSADSPEVKYSDIISAMQTLYGDDLPQVSVTTAEGRIYDESFNPIYLPCPIYSIFDTETQETLSDSTTLARKLKNGTVYRGRDTLEKNSGIDESFTFYVQTQELEEYASALGLTSDDYENLLFSAYTETGDESYSTLLYDYYSAIARYGNLSDNYYTSDKITELAEQITDGLTSDYDKAKALEEYFEKSGYVYDTDYVPPDESIEYFIFEGKTGVCSSYATAMTLMAQSIGLTARYVEGFAAFEPDEGGGYVVRGSQAHAFVEVYIPGAGWMTFDPTVSDYRNLSDSNFDAATFVTVLGKLLVVIAVAFAVIFILLLDRIVEAATRIKLKFKSPAERTIALYSNVIKLINFSAHGDYTSYTVKMLRSYLLQTRGCAPERLFSLFEKTCFGGYTPSAEEFNEAYREYKQCYRYLRKIPKKIKE